MILSCDITGDETAVTMWSRELSEGLAIYRARPVIRTRLHKATYPHVFTRIFQGDLVEGGLTSVGNQKKARESP